MRVITNLNFLLLVFLIQVQVQTYAQKPHVYYPMVGDTIANHTFTEVINYPSKKLTVSDLRGKWVVLDFWSRYCASCIASFPKMNKISHDFKNTVKLLMVGNYRNGNTKKKPSELDLIHSVYEPKAKNYKLDFTVAFDSLAGSKYDIYAVPSILVIDPNGVIRAKTSTMDSTTLAEIIKGNQPNMIYAYSENEPKIYESDNYKPQYPLYVSGHETNGGIDSVFLGRSLLVKWTKKMPQLEPSGWLERSKTGCAEAFAQSLSRLLRLGYMGLSVLHPYHDPALYDSINQNIVLETRKKNLFDNRDGKFNMANLFSYSVTLPADQASPENLRKTLLVDLERYFGFKTKMEIRKVDVYTLIVIDEKKVKKLKSKGGKSWLEYGTKNGVGFTFTNTPVSWITRRIDFQYGLRVYYDRMHVNYQPPILDKTNLKFNIDLEFAADPKDFLESRAELRKHGFDLVKAEEEMSCIIVSDN